MMVLGALSFDTSNPRLQHFSVHASGGGRLNHIARSDGRGPKNHGGNFGGFDAKTIFNCNVSFSEYWRLIQRSKEVRSKVRVDFAPV